MELETRNCTLCGPKAKKQVKYRASFGSHDLNPTIFSARRSPDKRHFRLVTCDDCGIIYSDPACPPDQLADLYEKSVVNYGGQEEEIYESYKVVLDRAARLTEGRNTFAEIGGGAGFMLRYGVENGFRRQVEIEPSLDAKEKFEAPGPEASFICDTFRPELLPENSVSLACFFQVLDHMPDPFGFVRDVHQCLEPGGVAVGVTHDTSALSAKMLGERSPIYDIEHTYLFNRRNVYRMFREAGFDEVHVFSIANRYSARYWFNLFPSPPIVKEPAMRMLEGSRLADVRINLRAGNLAVIGRRATV